MLINPATGQVEFVPTAGTVVLQQPSIGDDLDTCTIDYTVTVNKVPNHDAVPAAPGIQTATNASAVFFHPLSGQSGGGSGSDVTTVLQAAPAIVTQVSAAGVQNGTSFTDTATLSGLVNPVQGPGAGSVTYSVFGPNDPTCAGPDLYLGTDDIVTGDGDYTSDPFTPPGPGTYFWVVTYTGDLNNAPVTSPCGAPNENVRVIDIDIDKTVTPASQPAPTGTFTYSIVVTNPTPFPLTINTLDDDIYGNIGTEAIEAGDPVITGNTCDDLIGDVIPANSSTAPCTFVGTFTGLPGDTETDIATVVVTDPVTGATATASDDAVVELTTPPPPVIAVDKTAAPDEQLVPGGDFTFTVVVTNTGTIPIEITSLDDDIYGNIGTEAIEAGDEVITGNTCDDLIGDTLAPAESSAPCSFTGPFNSATAASQTDIVTVVGTDFIGRTATDSDDATVRLILPAAPQIAVDKTATPLVREAPGGDFTFTVVVNNPGTIPVTITTLDDDIYGNIGTEAIEAGDVAITANTCDDLIGDVLAPGATSAPCSFTGPFDGDAGESQTDIVTVVGTDDFGRTVTDDDDAVVSLIAPPPPLILVDKTVTPASLPVPGGDFTFNVVVTNIGVRPLIITSLTDDIYGNIGAPSATSTCDDLIGDTLAPAESASCSFVGAFNNATPDSQTDIVTVVGTDTAGTTVTDTDDAVVTLFIPTAPQIDLIKTATPLTRFVPGGDFTFDVTVSNPGTIPVTITSLVDDVYGNIGGAAFNGTCDDLIGDTLAPGASASCSFVGPFNNATPATQTDIVTVTGTGNGQTVTADDDATVALVPLPPLSVVVDKTASPLSRPVPGGDFTFTVIVRNPGTVALTITSLTDDIYGDIGAPSATSTCDDLIGTVLAPGANSAPCSFTRPFTGVAGASQTDIVTVIGTDSFGQTATDSDDATVTLTPRPAPLVQVDKTVTPGSRVEPGGDFTFSVVVSNPSTVPIVITSLVDNVHGNLATRGEPNTCDDLIGDTVAPGASTAPCSFTASFTGVAGDSETDIVTVIAVDEIGQTVTDTDDAVITLTPRPPGPLSIDLDKTATPGTMLEPGGTFTFNVVVTNTSDVPLTITSLTDDIYGNLGTRSGVNSCDDLIGDVLSPGASASCSFEGTFTGNAGDSQTDVVTVIAEDDGGRTVDDDDDAEVELTDVLPRIQIVKTASPLERVAPGGSFTFRVEVTNPGTEPIELTELTDDIYGDLNGKGTCDTGGTIAAGATYTCEFTGEFTGTAGQTQTDVVTAVGEDDEGNEVQDNDDATVKLTPPPSASPTPSPSASASPTPTPTGSPTPAPTPTKPPAPPLARTGADFLPFFALALALISAGFILRSRQPASDSVQDLQRRRRHR